MGVRRTSAPEQSAHAVLRGPLPGPGTLGHERGTDGRRAGGSLLTAEVLLEIRDLLRDIRGRLAGEGAADLPAADLSGELRRVRARLEEADTPEPLPGAVVAAEPEADRSVISES